MGGSPHCRRIEPTGIKSKTAIIIKNAPAEVFAKAHFSSETNRKQKGVRQMLQLVAGPSGSGKSSYLMKEIRKRAENGQKSILLVPEQFTSSAENRIYRSFGDELSSWVESYSFTSLAEKILTVYGGIAVRSLTDAGRVVMVRRALDAFAGEQLPLYFKHRHNTAFCVKCVETLNEFRNAGIDPVMLADLAARVTVGGAKLSELSKIYSAYQAQITQAGMDPADRLEVAAGKVEPDFFKDRAVFVDEFDTFNAPKCRLLEKILAFSPRVSVALCTDDTINDPTEINLFRGAKNVAQSLKLMARKASDEPVQVLQLSEDLRHKEAPALAALATILQDKAPAECPQHDKAITLYKAESRAQEAKAVAAALRRQAVAGVPYGKMAVICRESEEYLSALRYELRLQEIPFFYDGPATAEQAAPLRLVRALLGLLRRGLCTEEILNVAKTGLISASEAEICAMENYAYTWTLSAEDWRKEFTQSPQGFGGRMTPDDAFQLKMAEKTRSYLVPILDDFRAKAKGCTALQLCRLIYNTMIDLGSNKRIISAAQRLAKTDGIPAQDETIRTWNLTMNLLDQMALLLGEEALKANAFSELFDLLVSTTDLGHIPQSVDSVIITSANRMRLDNPEYCFVLGLGEGQFPRVAGDAGLLTHAERESIMAQNQDMPDCFANQMIREQVSFYKALTAASKGLWLSWTSGAQALPVTGALREALALLQPDEPDLPEELYAGTPAAALDLLGQGWELNSGKTGALYDVLAKQADARQLLMPVTQLQSSVLAVTEKDTVSGLLGEQLNLSPSRMERYYSCPFTYFMEYVLGAKERRKADMTADQSGNLIHHVMEIALQAENPAFVDLTQEQLAELSGRIVDEYVKENMPGAQKRLGYLVERLKKTALGALQFLQEEQRQGKFVPVRFEMSIGTGEGDELAPVVMMTPDRHKVAMMGKIDRVDVYTAQDEKTGETTNWVRVVDYKTGTKELLESDVEKGINCQMLVYLFAIADSPAAKAQHCDCAGVLYMMADPGPKKERRQNAAKAMEYTVEGMVRDEEDVLKAMDSAGKGIFIPKKTKRDSRKSQEQFAQLKQKLDALILQMTDRMYDGRIEAKPAEKGKEKRMDCAWCKYRGICGREKPEK